MMALKGSAVVEVVAACQKFVASFMRTDFVRLDSEASATRRPSFNQHRRDRPSAAGAMAAEFCERISKQLMDMHEQVLSDDEFPSHLLGAREALFQNTELVHDAVERFVLEKVYQKAYCPEQEDR